MNKVQFKTRKEVSTFLKEKNIDTTNWTEEKWQSINTSQAEIHIQALAEAMWDAKNESIPKLLKSGEWHIPFSDKMNTSGDDADNLWQAIKDNHPRGVYEYFTTPYEVFVATARCARLSYMTFDGDIDYDKDIKLHNQLLESKHFSPFEHCARAMSEEEYFTFIRGKMLLEDSGAKIKLVNSTPKNLGWCNNFRGFIPYRYILENNI